MGVDAREGPGGFPRGLISPLPVRPLPHDLCHGRDSPCWLPAGNNSRDSQRGTLKGRRRGGSGLRCQNWRSSTAAGDHMTSQPTEGGNLGQMFPDAQPGNRGSPGRFIPQESTASPGEPSSQDQSNAPLIGRSQGALFPSPLGLRPPPPAPPTHRHHIDGRHQKRNTPK